MEQLDLDLSPRLLKRGKIYPNPKAIFRLMWRVEIPLDESDEDGNDVCWEIGGRRDPDGYGHFYLRLPDGKLETRAHRSAWILNYGPVPDGLRVLHRCDNPPCVRVSHLFLGTDLDNMLDRAQKKRHPHGITHPKAKLTDADVVAMRALGDAGKKAGELGPMFGVSPQVAHKVIKRKAWVHIP